MLILLFLLTFLLSTEVTSKKGLVIRKLTASNSSPRLPENHGHSIWFSEVVKENIKSTTKYYDVCSAKRRILGGVKIDRSKAPYVVALSVKRRRYWLAFCGGTLITYSIVLTAAHCFVGQDYKLIRPVSQVRVLGGAHYPVEIEGGLWFRHHSRSIKTFFSHSKYNPTALSNDLGIIEVSYKFQHTYYDNNEEAIRPVRLHTPDLGIKVMDGETCMVAGYGLAENNKPSKQLQMVCLPLVSSKTCAMLFGSVITPLTICAGEKGKDSCQGDSGGPLVCNGLVVGVLSFGSICGMYPGVYTRLMPYVISDALFEVPNDKGSSLRHEFYLIFITELLLIKL